MKHAHKRKRMQTEFFEIGVIIGLLLLGVSILYYLLLVKFAKQYSIVVLLIHCCVMGSMFFAGWQLEGYMLKKRGLLLIHQDTTVLTWSLIWLVPMLFLMHKIRRRFKSVEVAKTRGS
jgi:hypothetical protein